MAAHALFIGFTRARNPVLELDLAREEEAVGSSVRCFKAGDAVIAFADKHFGDSAEYAGRSANGLRDPQDALMRQNRLTWYAEAGLPPILNNSLPPGINRGLGAVIQL